MLLKKILDTNLYKELMRIHNPNRTPGYTFLQFKDYENKCRKVLQSSGLESISNFDNLWRDPQKKLIDLYYKRVNENVTKIIEDYIRISLGEGKERKILVPEKNTGKMIKEKVIKVAPVINTDGTESW